MPGAEKMLKFIDLADTFHLPIVYMMDVPGYFIGPESERAGRKEGRSRSLRHASATTPWVTVLLRRSFGVAGAGHGQYNRLNLRYAWPSGRWGSPPIAGGAMAAFRREIEAAADPEAKRAEIEKRLADIASPMRTANHFSLMGVEEVIDPLDTRSHPLRIRPSGAGSQCHPARPKNSRNEALIGENGQAVWFSVACPFEVCRMVEKEK